MSSTVTANPTEKTESTKDNFALVFSVYALQAAWKSIALKNTCPGVDKVSISDFEKNLEQNLSQLSMEIINKTYKPQPLIIVKKPKDQINICSSKFREISIPTVRDKVAARTASDFELAKVRKYFSVHSYAYLPHKGVLDAVMAVEREVANFQYAVRIDIKDFFDSIDHEILENILTDYGNNEQFRQFIKLFLKCERIDNGNIVVPEKGVPLGIPLAPVLANIYLTGFDKALEAEKVRFVRYADDIVIFSNNIDQAYSILNLAEEKLNDLHLQVSVNKTRIYKISEGFAYLGFVFTKIGKTPTKEAKMRLKHKLASPKYDDETQEEYLCRIATIKRGWSNYYLNDNGTKLSDNQPDNGDMMHENLQKTVFSGNDYTKKISDSVYNPLTDNISQSSMQYITIGKQQYNNDSDVQTVGDSNRLNTYGPCAKVQDLIADIDKLITFEKNVDAISKLRKLLAGDIVLDDDIRRKQMYKLASLYEKTGLIGAAEHIMSLARGKNDSNTYVKDIRIDNKHITCKNWINIFDTDIPVYKQYMDRLGRYGYKQTSETLSEAMLKEHWSGINTLAVSLFDKNNTVRFAVLDIDISRKALNNITQQEFQNLKALILEDAKHIANIAFKEGLKPVIEDSGYKGYHIWFFFHSRIPASTAKDFLTALNRIAGTPPERTHRELFPSTAKMPQDNLNSKIKLPLGLHKLTGNFSSFIRPDGTTSDNGHILLNSMHIFNKSADIRRVTNKWNQFINTASNASKINDNSVGIDRFSSKITKLFDCCNVLKAIKIKAETTHSLNHYERVILRSVLMPLGEQGREAIHYVLKHCSNYNKNITDKNLANAHPNPMGCLRIQEILSYMTEQVDCNCRFRKKKNDYAHPLRHIGFSLKTHSISAGAASATTSTTNSSVSGNTDTSDRAHQCNTESVPHPNSKNSYSSVHENQHNKKSPNKKNRFFMFIKLGPVKLEINI